MLNKKAQVDDNTEIIVCILGILMGVIILFVLEDISKFNINSAKELVQGDTDIQTYDAKLMGTDLLNIAKLPLNDKYTFSDLIATMPDNYPIIQDSTYLKSYLSDRLGCNDELYNQLNEFLTPIYGENWIIYVYDKDEMIFFCSPITFDYAKNTAATLTLPSSTPGKNLLLSLEVYQ